MILYWSRNKWMCCSSQPNWKRFSNCFPTSPVSGANGRTRAETYVRQSGDLTWSTARLYGQEHRTSKWVYNGFLCICTFCIWGPCTFFFFFFFVNLKIDTSTSTLAVKPFALILFVAVLLLLLLTTPWCIWRICDAENLGPFISLQAFQDGTCFRCGIVPRRRSNVSASWGSHLPSHKKNKKKIWTSKPWSAYGSFITWLGNKGPLSVFLVSGVNPVGEGQRHAETINLLRSPEKNLFSKRSRYLLVKRTRPLPPPKTSAASPSGLMRADRIWPHERPLRPQEVLQTETRVHWGEDFARKDGWGRRLDLVWEHFLFVFLFFSFPRWTCLRQVEPMLFHCSCMLSSEPVGALAWILWKPSQNMVHLRTSWLLWGKLN